MCTKIGSRLDATILSLAKMGSPGISNSGTKGLRVLHVFPNLDHLSPLACSVHVFHQYTMFKL